MASWRAWAGLGALLLLLGVTVLQAVNTWYVRERVCGPDQQACRGSTGFLELDVERAMADEGPLAVIKARLNGTTALLRRACSGQWTLGLGGRLNLIPLRWDGVVAGAVASGCADLGATRSTGALFGVEMSLDGCTLTLAPVKVAWRDELELRATARVQPGAAPACTAALGERVKALGLGAPETWQLALNSDYGLAHGKLPKTPGPGVGLLRHILREVPMNHEFSLTAGKSRVALGLASRPAVAGSGVSPELTLTADVIGPLVEQLPPDIRLLLANGTPIQLRWNLDHEKGTVRVQGQMVKRVATSLRPPGAVDLSGECPKGETAQLYFVEAGERGEAVAPAQLQAVRSQVDAAQARAGVLVSVFVHGWQHSAAPGDSYVCDFSTLLSAVGAMERNAARASGRPAREVLGVYVGWPGRSYPTGLAELTTFWNRLDVADRLGEPAGALSKLMQLLGESISKTPRDLPADRRSGLVVTGHSMGARAVFHAVQHAFQPSDSNVTTQALLPNLLLMVNPAFSAEQFRVAHESRIACIAPNLPMLLFSSEADAVTRQVYPAGQVATYDQAHQRQVDFFEHVYTAANFEAFVTHRLNFELLPGQTQLPEPTGPQHIMRGFERVPEGSRELYQDNPITVYRQPKQGRPKLGDAWYRMRVVPVGRRADAPPDCATDRSRVMTVDARILPDHGTIFTPAFMEFVIRSFNRGRGTTGGRGQKAPRPS